MLEQLLVNKLKSSILVGAKGMSEQIITNVTSCSYDILLDVCSEAVCYLLQENQLVAKFQEQILMHVTVPIPLI